MSGLGCTVYPPWSWRSVVSEFVKNVYVLDTSNMMGGWLPGLSSGFDCTLEGQSNTSLSDCCGLDTLIIILTVVLALSDTSSDFDIYFTRRSNTAVRALQPFTVTGQALSLTFWISFLDDSSSFPVQLLRQVHWYITDVKYHDLYFILPHIMKKWTNCRVTP